MPITYVGGSTQTGRSGPRSFVPPAGTRIGDWVLLVVQMLDVPPLALAGPPGIPRLLVRYGSNNNPAGERQTVYAGTLTAIPAAWTITVPYGAYTAATVLVYRGVGAVETISSWGPTLTGDGFPDPASLRTLIPSVTPAAPGGHLIAIGDWRSTLTAPPGLSPGYTLRAMADTGTWSYAIADRPVTTPGPTGPETWIGTEYEQDTRMANAILLRPSGGQRIRMVA